MSACALGLAALFSFPRAGRAERVVETWRSPFGRVIALSANAADGSCWAVTGSSVMHLALDGSVISQVNGFARPAGVAVNQADGSAWVADTLHGEVVHLAADGAELWRGGGFGLPSAVAVNSTDGSCWLASSGGVWTGVVHLAASGVEVWRGAVGPSPTSLSVDPADGSCWVGLAGTPDASGTRYLGGGVVHLSAEGTVLWIGTSFDTVWSVSANAADGSCWAADPQREEVVHLGADGTELVCSDWLYRPVALSVRPGDGACLVAEERAGLVTCVTEDGAFAWSAPVGSFVSAVAVDGGTGACWAGTQGSQEIVRLAQDGTEVWRARGRVWPQSVSANPSDGSCWAADAPPGPGEGVVLHLAADGSELWASAGFSAPFTVAVDPTDGSCWVGERPPTGEESEPGYLVHLDANGTEVWRGLPTYSSFTRLSLDPSDGSCWVACDGDTEVRHVAADGTALPGITGLGAVQSIAVSPLDGSVWVGDAGCYESGVLSSAIPRGLRHFAADGTLLWESGSDLQAQVVATNSADGSVWVGDPGNGLVHLGADGTELWRGQHSHDYHFVNLSVNPVDGSCWVAQTAAEGANPGPFLSRVLHIAASGTELWCGYGFAWAASVSVDRSDGSCWVADETDGQLVHLAVAEPPVATFSAVPTVGPVPLEVHFTDGSTGYPTSWSWDFGDGSTSTQQNPTHVYLLPGSHTVTLTAANRWGQDSATRENYIAVLAPLAASAGPDRIIAFGGSVPLEGSASGGLPPYAYRWSPPMWLSNPDVAQPIAFPGVTTIYALTVTDSLGRTDTDTATVTVASGVVAEAGPDKAIGAGGAVLLGGSASGGLAPYTFSWSPSTGLSDANAAQPIASPSVTTVYTLTVTDDLGQSDTDTMTVTVVPAPVADFTAAPRIGFAPLDVAFTDASMNGPVAWEWEFGDGAASIEQHPTHEYADVGTYTVALTATNEGGSDAETKPRYILVTFPDVPFEPEEHWALHQILACVDAGIVAGYPDGKYRPQLPVTRDQMAVFISRALAGGDANVPTGPAEPSFDDVATDHWAYHYVEYAHANDIVQGYPDGLYYPDVELDRAQMAVFVARAIATPADRPDLPSYTPPGSPTFPDVTQDNDWSWAYRFVEYCAGQGVVKGYDDGTYRPSDPVTRDQMAVYVQRASKLPM